MGRHGSRPIMTLVAERKLAGLTEESLDQFVAHERIEPGKGLVAYAFTFG